MHICIPTHMQYNYRCPSQHEFSHRPFPVLEAHSKKGETPLIWAAMQQQLDCLKVLITARANLNAQASNVWVWVIYGDLL